MGKVDDFITDIRKQGKILSEKTGTEEPASWEQIYTVMWLEALALAIKQDLEALATLNKESKEES